MSNESPLITTFRQNVQAFADARPQQDLEFLPAYGKTEDDLLSLTGRLYFSRFWFDFTYVVRSGSLVGTKSVLKCKIWLEKGTTPYCHTLYDLQFLLDPEDFRCYTFPYIESPARMTQCFQVLAEAAERYLPRIAQIAENPALVQEADDALYEDMAIMLAGKGKDRESFVEENIEFYTAWLDLRFTNSGYRAFLQENYPKAVRWYQKQKKKTGYEARLLAFLESRGPGDKYTAILPEQNSLRDGYKAEFGSMELPALLLSWFCLTPGFLLLYGLAYYGALYAINFGMLYSTGLPGYNAAAVFLPAFLTSICVSYYTRQKFYRLLYRKKREKILAYDRILNAKGDDRFIQGLTRVVVICCILFTVLSATNNITFYDDHMIVRDSFFSLRGEELSYDAITSLWRISGRTNGFGAWLDNPSYVLVTQTGRQIDLYEYLDLPETEEKVLPILQERGLTVKCIEVKHPGI